MDRRQKRTRKQLQKALIHLMHGQSYDEIRVLDIVEVADIALPTFYRHYENKLALLKDIVEYTVEHVELGQANIKLNMESLLDLNQPSPILPLTQLLYSNRVFFRRLLTTPHSHHIMQIALERFTAKIHVDTPEWESHEVDLIASILFGCLYNLKK